MHTFITGIVQLATMASSSSSSSTTRPVVVVTLVFRGQSEALPVEDLTAMTVQDCTEWAAALFGLENNNTDSSSSGSNSNSNDNMLSSSSSVHLYKDGVPLIPRNSSNISLHQAGIRHGDVIAVRVVGGGEQEDVATPSATTTSATGLDFSALLASSHNDTNINASFPRSSSTSTSSPLALAYTYYPGMSLSEAQHCNPHPTAFVTLLHDQQSNNNNNNKNEDSHLLKELHYYDPLLATQLRDSLFPTVSASAASSTTTTTSQEARLIQAAQIWRQAMVKVRTDVHAVVLCDYWL